MINVYILVSVLFLFGGMFIGMLYDMYKLYKKHYELSTKLAELEYKLFALTTIQEDQNENRD